MLKCAPYIKNVCHQINNHLWSDGDVLGDQSPQQSPVKKKDSEVKISDVKGFEVKVFAPQVKNTSMCVVDDLNVYSNPDLYKEIKKIRPDSPDVIRAAKRFEQARLKEKWKFTQILETTEEKSPDSDDVGRELGNSLPHLGAISKVKRYGIIDNNV